MKPEILARLVEVSRSLSGHLELESLLQFILDTATELTNSQDCSLLLFDEDTGHLRFVAASWYPRMPFKRGAAEQILVPLDHSVAGWVFNQAQSMIITDAKRERLVFRKAGELLDTEIISLIAAPLTFKGKTIGVVECVNKGMGNYEEDDIAILETLAAQAAVAIYNADLLAKARQAYNELAQLDRMKTNFIAITSHELRTPLGLIIGYATMLQEIGNEQIRSQVDVIAHSAARLKEIVENLSTINNFRGNPSKLNQNQIELCKLVKIVLKTYQKEAREKNIGLHTRLPQRDLYLFGDEEKIVTVLNNLIKNALAFTLSGGTVMATTEELSGFVKVSIIDTGIGIPDKDLHRIFERFYQVEGHMTRHHGGMGLGLSVAKDLVEMHGGRIWAESTPGKGSIFSFLLPINKPKLDKPPPFITNP